MCKKPVPTSPKETNGYIVRYESPSSGKSRIKTVEHLRHYVMRKGEYNQVLRDLNLDHTKT